MKYIIIDCENHHIAAVGLGDRLQGFIFSIVLGKIMNRKVLIKWKTPDISNICDIHEYDYFEYLKKGEFDNKKIITIDAGADQTKVKDAFSSPDIMNKLHDYDIINVICNTSPLIYLFMNDNLKEFHINEYESLCIEASRELFTKYIKPIGNLKIVVDEYYEQFHNDTIGTIGTIGIQIRTGDKFFDKKGKTTTFYPIEKKCEMIVNLIQNKISELELLKNNMKYNVFVTFDNPTVEPFLDTLFKQRKKIYLDYPVGHFAIQRSEIDLIKQFADLILLSKCDALIISHFSNFGRLPFLINPSNDKFALAIQSNVDEFGNTIGLGKNDDTYMFKIYKPSITDISCKHPDWKGFLTKIESKSILLYLKPLSIIGKYYIVNPKI